MRKLKIVFITIIFSIILAGMLILNKQTSNFSNKKPKISEFQITEVSKLGNVYINKKGTIKANIKSFKYPKKIFLTTDFQSGAEFIIKNHIFKLLSNSRVYYNSITKELKLLKGSLLWKNENLKKTLYLILSNNNQLELSKTGKIISLNNNNHAIWNYQGKLKLIANDNQITDFTSLKYIEIKNKRVRTYDILPQPKIEDESFTKILIRDTGDSIFTFRWQALSNVKSYKLQIFDSILMTNTIYSKYTKLNRFSLDLLKLNNYRKIYWNVRGIDKNNIEGMPSEIRTIQIEGSPAIRKKIVKPPKLIINSLTISGNMVIINGKTDPNAQLIINDMPVKIDMDGSFIHTITYKKIGIKTITVKAISPAELETTIEKKVTIFEE